jgi:hypothetical protein
MKVAKHWISLWLIWAPLALGATPESTHRSEGRAPSLADLRHVGVVSLFGDTFHGIGVGLKRLDNFRYTTRVPDWNIDQDCEDFLQTLLKGNGYAATLLDIRPRRADDLYSGTANDEPNFDELRRVATTQDVDTIIVVWRSQSSTVFDIDSGFGLFEEGVFGLKRVFPYAQFKITFIDVKTGRRIISTLGNATERKPNKTIPWKVKFEDFSDRERLQIKAAIEDHIHGQLLRTLGRMNVVKAPAH